MLQIKNPIQTPALFSGYSAPRGTIRLIHPCYLQQEMTPTLLTCSNISEKKTKQITGALAFML